MPCGCGSSRCCRSRRAAAGKPWVGLAFPSGGADGHPLRPAEWDSVANAPEGNGLWLGQHVLATIGAMAMRRGLRRLHAALLAELRQRGQLDLTRALVDSASGRALRGGKKLDRTQPIAVRRA